MDILRSGTYTLSKEQDVSICGDVVLFDTGDISSRIIRLAPESNLQYFSIFSQDEKYARSFFIEDGGTLSIRAGLFAFSELAMDLLIHHIGSHAQSDIKMHGWVFKDVEVTMNAHLNVGKEFEKIVCSLEQKSIFLSDHGRIRAIPALSIESLDVNAHHSCSIEHLHEKSRFYAESRGLSSEEAQKILLSGSVHSLYEGAPEFSQNTVFPLLPF